MVWSAEDWLKLGDATDGNCGILIYKASRDNINYCSSPDINHVVRQELVETTDHVTEPLTLPALFFYCTSNDYHKERIFHDRKFWERSLPKVKAFF